MAVGKMKSNGYIAGHPRPWRPFPGLTLQTRSSAALPPSSSSSFVPSGFLQADVVTLSPEALPSVCHLPSHPHFGSGALKSWRLSFLNILSSLVSSWGQWHRSSHPLGMAPCGATEHISLFQPSEQSALMSGRCPWKRSSCWHFCSVN